MGGNAQRVVKCRVLRLLVWDVGLNVGTFEHPKRPLSLHGRRVSETFSAWKCPIGTLTERHGQFLPKAFRDALEIF